MVVLRRPARIAHDGDTFTGWISTTATCGSPRYSAEGRLTKRLIFKGLGRDDHNNPSLVFRRDGHIMVFFSPHSGHHLPPPGIPSVMRYMVSLNPFSINGFGRVRTSVSTNAPRRPRVHVSEPDPAARTSCGCSGAAAAGTRRSRGHERRPELGPGPRARVLRSHEPTALLRSTSATARPADPRRLHERPPERTGRTACSTCATRPATCSRRAGDGSARSGPCPSTRRSST